MTVKWKYSSLFIILMGIISFQITFNSCEERFKPDLNPSSENLIVVDGMISNLPGPYTIKLSLSSKIESPEYIPLSGFIVEIEDDTGIREGLSETSSGNYVTDEQGIQGIPGRKYRLLLTSPGGRQYTTAFETLREPTGIASITHKDEIQTNDDLYYDIFGYRFYISTEQAAADSNYFMWQLVSTYKYSADFNIYWVYEGNLRRVYNSDSLKLCYITDTLPEIYLFNTVNLESPVITDFPLNYVSVLTRDLSIRYSLFVRQFSISESAYKFWKVVKEQNETLGDLYTKQPYQIQGNVYSVDNPDEIVLGYFMVAGVSEKRTFADSPASTVTMRYPVCILNEDQYRNFAAIWEFPPESWPIFATRGPEGNALPNQWCMDCRESGGVIEKPDFWIDQ